MSADAASIVTARRDPTLAARVVREVPLRYAAAADPAADRPAHVRAGSGLARVRTSAGLRLAVVQDDANFLALVDPATGLADAVALPPGAGGARQFDTARGNKLDKLDLESCLVLDDPDRPGAPLLVAFGSGSLAVRERVVLVRGLEGDAADADVRVVDATRLYALLRGRADFAGAELNVEGAARLRTADGDVVRLFARGNGAAAEITAELTTGAGSASATCDLPLDALLGYLLDPATAPAPPPSRITRYDLGALDGEPLGFTDATPWTAGDAGLGDAVLYLAAAERSANAVEDGPVAGSVLGVLGADGRARWAPLVEASGEPFVRKAEGVAPADAPGRVWIVLDVDDPTRPAALCEVVLDGAWGGPPTHAAGADLAPATRPNVLSPVLRPEARDHGPV